jgi:D-3-phosphoglycerate dehydrogenase
MPALTPADTPASIATSHDPDVVVFEDVWGPPFDLLADRFGVVAHRGPWDDREDVLQALGRARALVVRNRTHVDREVLERAPGLIVVGRAGVGLDNIDMTAADDLGVVVVSAPGANARSVAELALCLALALARDVVGHDRRVRHGRWERTQGRELSGSTWGVIGLGATGRAVAGAARSLGMRVIGHDPFSPVSPGDVDEVAASIPGVLARSDVVSLHLALSPESAGLVDAGFLAAMRPGALLVNVARGGLVNEDALADALDSGHLGGAALDVRADEPPPAGRLERNERVVLTPHVAGLTDEAQARVVEMLAGDLSAVLQGNEATHPAGCWRVPQRQSSAG